jgi:hypothetical protein
MATDNLGLDLINSSDYISPDPINANMEKLDALGVDYVVSQGTSGEWWYRKWNSGRAECGIDAKQFGETSLSSTGSFGYITGSMTFGAYPFNFTSRPFATISFEGDLNMSGRGSFVAQKHTTSTSASPYFFIVDWTESTAMKPLVGIYVCGKWK